MNEAYKCRNLGSFETCERPELSRLVSKKSNSTYVDNACSPIGSCNVAHKRLSRRLRSNEFLWLSSIGIVPGEKAKSDLLVLFPPTLSLL